MPILKLIARILVILLCLIVITLLNLHLKTYESGVVYYWAFGGFVVILFLLSIPLTYLIMGARTRCPHCDGVVPKRILWFKLIRKIFYPNCYTYLKFERYYPKSYKSIFYTTMVYVFLCLTFLFIHDFWDLRFSTLFSIIIPSISLYNYHRIKLMKDTVKPWTSY